ncbi:MAG TPA: Clp protease N-terminal domain-containing protein [Mycobacteriales bacterium]|jgi:ATP-dependent Clp protease ATP-binding subunit ClpA|nr:Clp protease N-terminal domain-containing protein [Mycobacteriales bacterium]
MFERFTAIARMTVVGAQDEARSLADQHIEPAHLWLGLLQHRGVAGEVLADCGVDADRAAQLADQIRRLRRRVGIDDADTEALLAIGIDVDEVMRSVEQNIGAGNPPRSPKGHIPFSRDSKRILEGSLREALDLHHTYIGSEHLLLALQKNAAFPDWNLDYLALRKCVVQRTRKAG